MGGYDRHMHAIPPYLESESHIQTRIATFYYSVGTIIKQDKKTISSLTQMFILGYRSWKLEKRLIWMTAIQGL